MQLAIAPSELRSGGTADHLPAEIVSRTPIGLRRHALKNRPSRKTIRFLDLRGLSQIVEGDPSGPGGKTGMAPTTRLRLDRCGS